MVNSKPENCVSCGADGLRRIGAIPAGHRFAATRLSAPLPPTDLWRCEQCQLRFRWPTPAPELLNALYQSGENELWDYDSSQRADFALAAQWLTAHAAGRHVLDIGCWDGGFLKMLEGEWVRHGVEINANAAERAKKCGVEIVGDDLHTLSNCHQRFDVVTAFDVVEHVVNPRDLLQKMAHLAKPGGVIVIGTGNAEAWTWRLMKSSYYYCVNPEHLSFISPEWCRIAAPSIDGEVCGLMYYSHGQGRTLLRRSKQAAANLAYRISPRLVETLRSKGIGKLDVSSHESWRKIPPTWIMANDHMLVVFRKTQ